MALRAVPRLAWMIPVRTKRLAGNIWDGSESHPYLVWSACGGFSHARSRKFRLASRGERRIIASVLRKLGLVFAALALFSIAGGQWAVLQTVAWAGMLHDYTQRSGSFTAAVEQTFDGEHPCELCREIAFAKAKERQERPAAPGVKENAKVRAMVAPATFLPPGPPATLLAWTRAAVPSGPSPRRATADPAASTRDERGLKTHSAVPGMGRFGDPFSRRCR